MLVGLVWIKNTDGKLRTSIYWVISYIFMSGMLGAVAYTQMQNGCGFSLGDCYSDTLLEGFWGLKLLIVLSYYLWFAAAVFSLARRFFGVSDKTAKKWAMILLLILCVAVIGFFLYLRSF